MDRRSAPWQTTEPRQRREEPWDASAPRQRRRPRWREFRVAYPRIVAGMAAGIGLLLAVDTWLVFQRSVYQRQIGAYRRDMSAVERSRADAVLESGEIRTGLMLELLRRQATGDPTLNLAVSVQDGVMRLQREGALLREMRAAIGPEALVGDPPDQVRLTPPLGKRTVLRVLRGRYRWEVPAWVFTQRHQPVPPDRIIEGALGPLAVVLSGGAVLYTTPERGPLAERSFVMPGSVRMQPVDLAAVAENLAEGTPVYFY